MQKFNDLFINEIFEPWRVFGLSLPASYFPLTTSPLIVKRDQWISLISSMNTRLSVGFQGNESEAQAHLFQVVAVVGLTFF